MHKDIDGIWKRVFTLNGIRVRGGASYNAPELRRAEWLFVGNFVVLEIRNPNEGSGLDPAAKSRYQYIAFASGLILERRLEPEASALINGSLPPPAFEPCDPSDYLIDLLREIENSVSAE